MFAFGVLALGAMYLFGVITHKYQLWPLSMRHSNPHQFDEYGRLASYPGKVEIPCPTPDYVIVILGQSNAANSGGQRYSSGAVNYYRGKCYRAESPLLGSSGIAGEPWSLMASKLKGTVVLVPAAVGSTSIRQWNGKLRPMLDETLTNLPYRVTHVIWAQGEEDYVLATLDYREQFEALLGAIRKRTRAPVYISISTRCGISWKADNPVAQAQRELPNGRDVLAGVDTDKIADRYEDCHFSAAGLERVAEAWAKLLKPLDTM
jgi:hypothetical protein